MLISIKGESKLLDNLKNNPNTLFCCCFSKESKQHLYKRGLVYN